MDTTDLDGVCFVCVFFVCVVFVCLDAPRLDDVLSKMMQRISEYATKMQRTCWA